jgi:hypothetical protein
LAIGQRARAEQTERNQQSTIVNQQRFNNPRSAIKDVGYAFRGG